MLEKLKSLFGGKPNLPADLSHDDQKAILETGETQDRKLLAARADAKPEVLYYLAEDSDADVRKTIAQNPNTPIQADVILTDDDDEEVREELARKIGRLVPGLTGDEQAALREKAISVLETLAADQLPKIRAVVAQEIKSSDNVPKKIVDQLARDVEDIVCTPILEYSPLLGDDDLREIIAAGTSSAALSAIASRPAVSEAISQDIAASLDIPAIAALLTNANAQVREDTLDQIIDQAESVEDLHKPLALRPQLSIRAMKRIAGFVASALVHAMIEKSTLPEEEAEDLLERVRERLAGEGVSKEEEAQYTKTAKDLFKRGALDDEFVLKQIKDNNRELLLQCLALMADLPPDVIRKIIMSKSGRAVTALGWKAGLAMRTAYEMQTKLALVPTAQLLSAKNGIDYPIDENELDWHLSYFTEQQE